MVVVEVAVADDIDDLIRLESALFLEDSGRHDPYADTGWPRREGRPDLEALIGSNDSLVLIARREGRPIGMLVGYTTQSSPTRRPVDYAVLRTLYVSEGDRRHGAAIQVTERFLDWARARGCVEAHVDHYAANAGAAAFYERVGFTPRSVSRALAL